MKTAFCFAFLTVATLSLTQCEKPKPPPPRQGDIVPTPSGLKPATPVEESGERQPGEVLPPGSGFPTQSGSTGL